MNPVFNRITDFVDAVSRTANSFGGAPAGTPLRLWEETRAWLLRFGSNTTTKWLPFYATATSCQVPTQPGAPVPCTNHAIGPCAACRRPTCMHHAFADQHGDAVCYLCIARIIRLAQEPGFAGGAAGAPYQQQPLPAEVRAEQIRRALAALELGPGASWKDVRSKHRALAAKHHPDRQRAAADKLAAAVRCKAVTEAFAQLKKLEYKPEEDRR